jgi:hypothetical protein
MTLSPFEYEGLHWEPAERGRQRVMIRVPKGHLFPELNQRIIIDDQLWEILEITTFIPPKEEVMLLVQ